MIHSHTLTPGLINTLKKFALAVRNKGNKIHIRHDLTLDISENNNFQKLKYWGLVAKFKMGNQHLSGYWVLTRLGSEFLKGQKDVAHKVFTEDNQKVNESKERINIKDKMGDDYWQDYYPSVNQEPLL
jgi:hypothetical protein